DESVGSPPSWVILFGDIPTVIPSTSVVAPEEFYYCFCYLSVAPVDPYVATVARWRSRVTTRLSSLSEFPIAPVIAPPKIRR
ncbi:hypothetical protein Tco_1397324, partial [Tanacetum coccineum]